MVFATGGCIVPDPTVSVRRGLVVCAAMAVSIPVAAGRRDTRLRAVATAGLVAGSPVAVLRADGDLAGVGGRAEDHVSVEVGPVHPRTARAHQPQRAYRRMSVGVAAPYG